MQASAMREQATAQLLVFRLDNHRYALPLAAVERVVPAVAITPLPDVPVTVLGIIDVAGRVVPVFDLRSRWNLPARSIDITDYLLLAQCTRGPVALVIDEACGVMAVPETAIIAASTITVPDSPVTAVVQLGELVLIHDLDQFLCDAEARQLERALSCATE